MRPTPTYNNDCSTGFYCRTDNSGVTYFSETTMNATSRTSVAGVLNSLYAPTDLSVQLESPPSYTGSSETDIIYQIGSLPNGVSGRTLCDDPIDSQKCDQHYVRFGNDFWVQNICCHETGHTVGLTHPTEAYPDRPNTDAAFQCLRNGGYDAWGLGLHNTTQIDSTY